MFPMSVITPKGWSPHKFYLTFSAAILVVAAWPCWTSGAVKEAMSSYRAQLLKARLPLEDSSTEPGLNTLHMLPEPKWK